MAGCAPCPAAQSQWERADSGRGRARPDVGWIHNRGGCQREPRAPDRRGARRPRRARTRPRAPWRSVRGTRSTTRARRVGGGGAVLGAGVSGPRMRSRAASRRGAARPFRRGRGCSICATCSAVGPSLRRSTTGGSQRCDGRRWARCSRGEKRALLRRGDAASACHGDEFQRATPTCRSAHARASAASPVLGT